MDRAYHNIADFITCRERCIFCDTILRSRLVSFSVRNNEVPIINAPICGQTDIVTFSISHTTPSWSITAKGEVNIQNNSLSMVMLKESDTPSIDIYNAKNAFINAAPHVQLYCPNRKCKQEYAIASNIFTLTLSTEFISPPALYYESFITGNLWVQNDYLRHKTAIFSRSNENAQPLMYPMMDFRAMGKERLLNRVRTLVVFS